MYWLGLEVGVAGRVLYRSGQGAAVAGRVLYRVSGGLVLEAGESSPCVLEMAGFRCFWACWESFVPVGPGGGCCWESFVPVGPGGGCCGESFVPGEWWIGVGSGRKFSLLGGVVLEAGENSPCSVAWCWKREEILPACLKWPDFGVFGRAGRVLYRLGPGVAVAGRVLYRLGQGVAVAGRVLYRVSGGLVLEAGESSPCSVAWCWNREKILPAREKWPDFGVFGRAGRVLYRVGPCVELVGGRVCCVEPH